MVLGRAASWRSRVGLSDVIAGACLCLIGAFVIQQALGMQLGSPSRMGPGYYPLLLGFGCIGLGVAIVVLEAGGGEGRSSTGLGRGAWRSGVLVPVSMVVFALLLERAGLAPACVALVCLASLAAPRFSVGRMIGLAIGTPVLAWLIFVVGLGLPFTVIEGVL